MVNKAYIVEGRQFRAEADYKRACKDRDLILELRARVQGGDLAQLKQLEKELNSGKHHFYTLLGQDFRDEVAEALRQARQGSGAAGTKAGSRKAVHRDMAGRGAESPAVVNRSAEDGDMPRPRVRIREADAPQESRPDKEVSAKVDDTYVQEMLRQRERRRKLLVWGSGFLAVCFLGYFGVYSYYLQRTRADYEKWNELRDKAEEAGQSKTPETKPSEVVIHYDKSETVVPEVLEKYANLFNKNKKLIGWVKIADTKIDYPVMQTDDNEYYLSHNMNQEYDKNGAIFMDKDCDILKPSTNLIVYGHNMMSGQMFARLEDYVDKAFYEKHPYIDFDTIYEVGVYQVMYVFRSKVYSEGDITFKYYQFINAVSEQEFDSNMQAMAGMSLYETGVSAQYGDRLLTLSTCDNQAQNGRFVVVAKKITAKEVLSNSH